MELAKVFLRDTPEEKRLFELLRSAYVEARYNECFSRHQRGYRRAYAESRTAPRRCGKCLPETIRLLQTENSPINETALPLKPEQ